MRVPLTLFISAILSSCSPENQSTYTSPPTYHTLHTKKTHGAFFQIRIDDHFYIASSIHQGGAAPKAQLFREGEEAPVILKKRYHSQKDLHLWTYERNTLPDIHALTFRPDVEIKIRDRIFILNKGKKIAATVVATHQGKQFRHTYKTDETFPAGGMSGSPIFLPRTGSVIGVLQTANHKKNAHFGGFEKIILP